MKKLLFALSVTAAMGAMAQSYVGQFSHNGLERDYNSTLHYQPTADGYIKCHNGSHLYTRALCVGNTSFRLETSDRPIFGAFYGKDNRNIHFILDINVRKMRLDSTLNCDSYYRGGERRDTRDIVKRHCGRNHRGDLRQKVTEIRFC